MLQEHWLTKQDLPYLNTVHTDFYAKGEAAVDAESGLLLGRPYGGVAILWRKSLANMVSPIVLNDERLIGIDIVGDKSAKYRLLCVYLPYQHPDNHDNYLFYLSKIKGFIDDSDTPFVYVFGDFNANSSGESEFYTELETLCNRYGLSIHDTEVLPNGSYTYISSAHGTTSWLDHIVTTQNGKANILNTSILYGLTTYDHLPMLVEMKGSITPVSIPRVESELFTFNWHKTPAHNLKHYFDCTDTFLSQIQLPLEALTCVNTSCSNELHVSSINSFYSDIVSANQQNNVSLKVRGCQSIKYLDGILM
jgi:hypothetical protein